MMLGTTVFGVAVKRDGVTLTTNILGKSKGNWVEIGPEHEAYSDLADILNTYKATKTIDTEKIDNLCTYPHTFDESTPVFESEAVEAPHNDHEAGKEIARALRKFFSEYGFKPSRRLINTLGFLRNSKPEMKKYILNTFEITDQPNYGDVKAKMSSPEFTDILDKLHALPYNPSNRINNRLTIYYGEPGTGKTTLALKLSQGKNIVCNSSMEPKDLLDDFGFEDGKPGFGRSAIRKAMEGGYPITLDEINLLPTRTLDFLQGLTDGKSSFEWDGEILNISDGFKIIGTMNLIRSGIVFPLSEALADRCDQIIHYEANDDDLADSLC